MRCPVTPNIFQIVYVTYCVYISIFKCIYIHLYIFALYIIAWFFLLNIHSNYRNLYSPTNRLSIPKAFGVHPSPSPPAPKLCCEPKGGKPKVASGAFRIWWRFRTHHEKMIFFCWNKRFKTSLGGWLVDYGWLNPVKETNSCTNP